MKETMPMDLIIADLQISEISDSELEAAFRRVLAEHKDAVVSIHQSMKDADEAYRKYTDDSYEPMEDVAKKDRATLNKAEKNIAEKYASLKAAYEKPLENIDLNIKSIRKAIKTASGFVDDAVKSYEEKQKSEKRKDIQTYFDSKKFDLVPLCQIFDEKWLNKGTKMKDIREHIDAKIAVIYRDIETLEKLPEHSQTVKAFYLKELDIGAALQHVQTLKENAERLAREQETREDRKIQEQVDLNAAEEWQEKWEAAKEERRQDLIDDALGLPAGTAATQAREEIIEYTMTFKGTKGQLLGLRQYMTANNIPYSKGLLLDNEDDAALVLKQKNLAGRIYSFIYVPAA